MWCKLKNLFGVNKKPSVGPAFKDMGNDVNFMSEISNPRTVFMVVRDVLGTKEVVDLLAHAAKGANVQRSEAYDSLADAEAKTQSWGVSNPGYVIVAVTVPGSQVANGHEEGVVILNDKYPITMRDIARVYIKGLTKYPGDKDPMVEFVKGPAEYLG